MKGMIFPEEIKYAAVSFQVSKMSCLCYYSKTKQISVSGLPETSKVYA